MLFPAFERAIADIQKGGLASLSDPLLEIDALREDLIALEGEEIAASHDRLLTAPIHL